MVQHRAGSGWGIAALVAGVSAWGSLGAGAEAAELSLFPTFDADFEYGAAGYVPNAGEQQLLISNPSGQLGESLGVLEFDISAIPDGAVLTSATLRLSVAQIYTQGEYVDGVPVTTYPALLVSAGHGNGDGAVNASDLFVTVNPVAATEVTALGQLVLDLALADTPYPAMQSLLDTNTTGHLNFRLFISDLRQNHALAIRSTEGSATNGTVPRLTLNYTVPEPATLALLPTVAAWVAHRWRGGRRRLAAQCPA